MLKNFTPRLYQETILNTCSKKNTLVVLPTGLGKTHIFLMLASLRLKQFPESKIMLIGPTKPLVEQYKDVFTQFFDLDPERAVVFTGLISPDKRAELWKNAQAIFSTPQGLENDVLSGRISFENVSLLGIDEAHRAVGDYAYVWLAKHYMATSHYPRILGLTASPGTDIESITQICSNLFIEDIEIRTEDDPDVRSYVQEVEIEWVKVDLPKDFLEIKALLESSLRSKLGQLRKYGLEVRVTAYRFTKKDTLRMQAELRGKMAESKKDFRVLKGVSILAEIIKLQHALELLETQGIYSLQAYFTRFLQQAESSKVKAVKNLSNDENFRNAVMKTSLLFERGVEHPKLEKLKGVVKEATAARQNAKVIVFSQFRDSASKIVDELSAISGISPKIFVGQMKKGGTGLSQKEQKSILNDFRETKFNTLVATSVGEEGLDVPSVDLVVFYEPIPSAIRSIQRRGRTGRQEKGKVVILLARSTRDEAFRWVAHSKERKMRQSIQSIKRKLTGKFVQPTLEKYAQKSVKIYCDSRERSAGVLKSLTSQGADLILMRLEVGDYVLSSRLGVEHKTVEDFIESLIDGRLLSQIARLSEGYEKPVLLIEGTKDVYSVRGVHPNAIRGLLAAIAVDFGVPIIYTKDADDTAGLLIQMAKREKEAGNRQIELHPVKRAGTISEQQEYLVSSLPGIGPSLAKPLLRKFKTPKKLFSASEEKLRKVDLIGEKKAKEIRKVLDSEYEE